MYCNGDRVITDRDNHVETSYSLGEFGTLVYTETISHASQPAVYIKLLVLSLDAGERGHNSQHARRHMQTSPHQDCIKGCDIRNRSIHKCIAEQG